MSVRLIDCPTAPVASASTPARRKGAPAENYDAIPHLTRLRDRLATTLAASLSSQWKEPPIFFLDQRRQAELAEARQTGPINPFDEISATIAAELPTLIASIDVRRVARAIDGLHRAAQTLGMKCSAAKELADLLAIPDDEVIVVLFPAQQMGFRFAIRGIADVGQFHILLANAFAADSAARFLVDRPFAERFVTASRFANTSMPAGVPMVAEARFQLYGPAALQADGSLPSGMGGCEHWLHPTMPLCSVPRSHGEGIVLAGPPVFLATWEVPRRFPSLPAELRTIETLSPFRVAERLTRLAGRPIAPVFRRTQAPELSKTA